MLLDNGAPEARHWGGMMQPDSSSSVGQALDLNPFGQQLRIDPVADMEDIDRLIESRERGSRPGLLRLLTERRDAMRSLAQALHPGTP